MNHPNIKTRVVHSKSKSAWNVVGTELGKKFKIARIPYAVDSAGVPIQIEKLEALKHANFISYCFNNPEKVM